MKDYYHTLGVRSTATPAEIRQAYREKAQKLHPDKESGCKDKFAALQEAYDVLRDPDKRARYDLGEDVSQNQPTLDDLAVSEIMGIFQQWLQQALDGRIPWNGNCIADIDRNLVSMLNQARQNQQQVKMRLSKLEKMIGHFEVDNDEPNFFEGQLLSVKSQFDKNQKELEKKISILELAVTKLKHFSYSPEEGLYQQPAPAYAGTATATGVNF